EPHHHGDKPALLAGEDAIGREGEAQEGFGEPENAEGADDERAVGDDEGGRRAAHATRPFTAQARTARSISPSGPIGRRARTASLSRARAGSSRDMQYFGADPVPPRNGV